MRSSREMEPCRFEGVETDVSRFVNVAMIYLCFEANFRRTERICLREIDIKREYAFLVPETHQPWGRKRDQYGDPCGPKIVACQCNKLSSTGAALRTFSNKD
jgi:hypothetical protein